MLKTISAALLAVSVIAAPALAAGQPDLNKTGAVSTTKGPVIKAHQGKSKVSNTAAKPEANADAKARALNANARMIHHRHDEDHALRHHHRATSMKLEKPTVRLKASAKQIVPTTAKRS